MLDRDDDLRTMHTDKPGTKNVQPGSTITTDEHPSFAGLSGRYYHHTVNHSAGEYVRHFCIRTNGVQSFWALLKRPIIGARHIVSPKRLSRYLDEMTWRVNRREDEEEARVNDLLACADRNPLACRALIA